MSQSKDIPKKHRKGLQKKTSPLSTVVAQDQKENDNLGAKSLGYNSQYVRKNRLFGGKGGKSLLYFHSETILTCLRLLLASKTYFENFHPA